MQNKSQNTFKIAFLDRDGVIIKEVDHINHVSQLEVLPHVAEAVKKIREKGYCVVVISNQAAVAKGIATAESVEEINGELKRRLLEQGASFDGIYTCLHHPKGTVAPYNVDCDCRKPKTGMVTQAVCDLEERLGKKADLAHSIMVGDKTGDILTGHRMGMKTILVETGYGGKDGLHDATPHFTAKDLLDAVKYF